MAAEDPDPKPRSLYFHQAADVPSEVLGAGVAMPRAGDIVAGKYRVECLIGRGGMGAVYRATHIMMDKPVAVKWLVPDLHQKADARERFVREARAAARIRHPNVVDVYDVGEQDGALYMVMELLVGEAFDEVLARGDLPLADALTLLVQAMWGVQAAHDKGIIHRDVKPENLFVVHDPTAPSGRTCKVLDFGISKLTEDGPRNHGLTQTGAVMGTPAYMSLEQMRGSRHVDPRADVYAFGVLLYQSLTGEVPFDGDTYGAIAVAIATHTPPEPKVLRPDLPVGLNAVVLRAMARQREERYPTLQAMIDALTTLAEVEGRLGRMTQPTLPPSRTPAAVNRGLGEAATGSPVGTLGGLTQGHRSRWAWVSVLSFGLLGVALAVASAVTAGLGAPQEREAVAEVDPPSPPALPAAGSVDTPAHVDPPPGTAEASVPARVAPVVVDTVEAKRVRVPAAAPRTVEVDAPAQAEALAERPVRKPAPRLRRPRDRRKARPPAAAQLPATPSAVAEAPAQPPAEAPAPTKAPRPARSHRSGGVSLEDLIGAP